MKKTKPPVSVDSTPEQVERAARAGMKAVNKVLSGKEGVSMVLICTPKGGISFVSTLPDESAAIDMFAGLAAELKRKKDLIVRKQTVH